MEKSPNSSQTNIPDIKKKKRNHDIQQVMNIHHFEELMRIFQEEKKPEEAGFTIDKFREVFGRVFEGILDYDEITSLFMKIDANSDGTVDWDEFSTYMMMGSMNSEEKILIFEEQPKYFNMNQQNGPSIINHLNQPSSPHKDIIKAIFFIAKERKYISISRDGIIALWTPTRQLLKVIDGRELSANILLSGAYHSNSANAGNGNSEQSNQQGQSSGNAGANSSQSSNAHLTTRMSWPWVTDAVVLQEGKVVLSTDDRRVWIYEILGLKPRLLAVIGPLEGIPLTMDYVSKIEDGKDLLLWGDDVGFVNILYFGKKFFMDHVGEDRPCLIDPMQLNKKENQLKFGMTFKRRQVHKDWISKIQYFSELSSYITCSKDPNTTLSISTLDRKTPRSLHLQKGLITFTLSIRPSFLITGGHDKMIRLWNPFVLTKPAGSLSGHNAAIIGLQMNHEQGHVLSLSEDHVVKIWSTRSLQCLQTISQIGLNAQMKDVQVMMYDALNKCLLFGTEGLEHYELYRRRKTTHVHTHDAPIVSALFNDSFHQVVTGCKNSAIKVWHLSSSEKIFQFSPTHAEGELTSLTFDHSRRRLLTSGRDGIWRMWNFNNGQMLQQGQTAGKKEITQIMFVDTTHSTTTTTAKSKANSRNLFSLGQQFQEEITGSGSSGSKYIVTVGWDNTISLFPDDCGDFQTEIYKEWSGKIANSQPGHQDDILCMDYHSELSLLATGSLDGLIVIWSFESGFAKCCLKVPGLNEKLPFERGVEKVLFKQEKQKSAFGNAPILISCHADGYVRFWDVDLAQLMFEMNLQTVKGEGLTAMSLSHDAKYLLIGDSNGNIKILDISKLEVKQPPYPYQQDVKLLLLFRAHLQPITSVEYIPNYELLLTSSSDASVRLWQFPTTKHIGIFGQESEWELSDPKTYAPIPSDVEKYQNDAYQQIQSQSEQRQVHLKEKVIKKLMISPLGITPQMIDFVEMGMKKALGVTEIRINVLRQRVIMHATVLKWKQFIQRKKRHERQNGLQQQISDKETKFFTFKEREKNTSKVKVIPSALQQSNHYQTVEAVFHRLHCYALSDLQLPTKPPSLLQKQQQQQQQQTKNKLLVKNKE